MKYLPVGLKQKTTLALTVATLASPALAQVELGMVGTLRFSQGLEISDNPSLAIAPGDTVVTSRTSLGFGLSSETTTQRFFFSIGGDLVKDFSGGATDDFEVEDKDARLEYRREGATSTLTFYARQRDVELDDEVIVTNTGFFGFSFGPEIVVIDTGSVAVTSVGLRYELGTNESPFGLDLRTDYRDSDYTGTVDPDLEDTERLSFDALARFDLSSATSLRARLGYSQEDQDDASNTEITDTYYGIGLESETAGGLKFTGDILFDRSETDTGSVSTDDGIGVDVSVRKDRSDGSIGASLTSRIDDSGRRTIASVRRDIDMPLGSLGFSIGVVDQEDDTDLRYTAGLNYKRETQRGEITASLSQTPGTENGDTVISTQFSLGYSADINQVSGWAAGVSFFEANELSGSGDDTRTSASISYRRDLTDEWGINAGFSFTRVDEAGVGESNRNTVFFNIQRDISFGF